jgi:cytochrome c553
MKKYTVISILFLCIAAGAFFAACNSNSSNPTVSQVYTGDATHGKYLVETVTGCADCHSQLDQQGNIVAATKFAGGQRFYLGPQVGAVYSRNITQDSVNGIGAWTDAEIITAIRTGIIPMHAMNGVIMSDTLFPVMPYQLLGNYSDNDMQDIVAYLRTIKAVKYAPPMDTVFFRPLAALETTIPTPASTNDVNLRGKYLVTVGLCADCHTQRQAPPSTGLDMTKFLAGGFGFDGIFPNITIYSANITPDMNTGIGMWSDAQIDTAFQAGKDDKGKQICPPMPWARFAGLSQADAQAIIAYLHTVPAVKDSVPDNCPF